MQLAPIGCQQGVSLNKVVDHDCPTEKGDQTFQCLKNKCTEPLKVITVNPRWYPLPSSANAVMWDVKQSCDRPALKSQRTCQCWPQMESGK